MEESGDPLSALRRDLQRLIQRCRPWPLGRWEARAHARTESRGELAYSLVVELAAMCPLTPPGAVPPRLRDLALADQLAVVGGELLGWLEDSGDLAVAARARDLVRQTRDALEPAPLG